MNIYFLYLMTLSGTYAMKNYKTKKEMVYSCLRQEIVEGAIEAGAKLTISALAQKYGVSEIPVREATQLLIQEGYLLSGPHQGLKVSEMTEEDIVKIFDIRASLESLAARRAVQLITDEEVEHLYAIIEESKKARDNQDFHSSWVLNQKFHRAINCLCGNEKLIQYINELMNYSHRYPQYYSCVEHVTFNIQKHVEIVGALAERNASLVEDMIRVHMVMGGRTVRERVRTARQRIRDGVEAAPQGGETQSTG